MIYQRQYWDIKGDIMTENKQVQIIIRTTQEEKAIITSKAKIKVFVNEFYQKNHFRRRYQRRYQR